MIIGQNLLAMTEHYYPTAADLRAALVAQLYDDWHGHYVLRRLVDGMWQDVRTLSRSEALAVALSEDEALGLVYERGANHVQSV